MSTPSPDPWFPAKRYGLGWGFPSCWQGWLVLGIYIALLTSGSRLLLGRHVHPAYFMAFVAGLTLVLILVVWAKGAPLRWRWGKD